MTGHARIVAFPVALLLSIGACSCAGDDGECTEPVIVVVADSRAGPDYTPAPVCNAMVSVVSGGERIPLDTPASCRWAYRVDVGSKPITLEIAGAGFETQQVTLAPRGGLERRCGGAWGCMVVWLR